MVDISKVGVSVGDHLHWWAVIKSHLKFYNLFALSLQMELHRSELRFDENNGMTIQLRKVTNHDAPR